MISDKSALPNYQHDIGLRTELGAWVPPGARVIYVGSSRIEDRPTLSGVIYPTLAAALPQCRANMGDTIFILPGHSESVTTATALSSLVAGTRIIGLGRGTNRGTFRWTATGAQWAISVANVEIAGIRLQLEGIAGIVKAVNITGIQTLIRDCDIEVGSATGASVIAVEFGTGCHGTQFVGNVVRGTVAGAVTDCLLVAGVSDGLRIVGNEIVCSTGAVGTGCIRGAAVAATNVVIANNKIRNSLASSETGIGWGDAAATGWIGGNWVATEAGTPVSDGIECHTNSLFRFFDNRVTDTKGTSGLLGPAVVT